MKTCISFLKPTMIYCNIDIILSLYNVYNDSIMYNHGIVYILQAAFSVCFMFWMPFSAVLCTWLCPKQLTMAFFLSPLLLSLLLALIKVACVVVLFFQRCVPQCRQGHSFLQCVRCRKRGYGSSCPCFNVSATLIYWSKGNCFVDRWSSICDTL